MSVPLAKKETVRLTLTLVITCLISGALLAAVYGWMGPVIEARRTEQVRSVGLDGIFPDADTLNELTLNNVPDGVEEPIYEVVDAAGEVLGIWFTGTSRGFGGPVRMAIGINSENASVVGARVLEHEETPGLGSPIEEMDFLDQLTNKSLSDPFEIGNDVSGLTAATVSSRAVFDGVSNLGRDVLAELGIEIDETDSAEDDTQQVVAEEPQVIEPDYASTIRDMFGEHIAFAPADVWRVEDDGELIGIATVQTEQGYRHPIEVMVVVDPNAQEVAGISVLRENETPGLGGEVSQPKFLDQFIGKSMHDAFHVGADVDGLTMATTSSQAVADAAKAASQVIVQLYADAQ